MRKRNSKTQQRAVGTKKKEIDREPGKPYLAVNSSKVSSPWLLERTTGLVLKWEVVPAATGTRTPARAAKGVVRATGLAWKKVEAPRRATTRRREDDMMSLRKVGWWWERKRRQMDGNTEVGRRAVRFFRSTKPG